MRTTLVGQEYRPWPCRRAIPKLGVEPPRHSKRVSRVRKCDGSPTSKPPAEDCSHDRDKRAAGYYERRRIHECHSELRTRGGEQPSGAGE